MWKAFFNIFKVKELRSRLLFTALIIVLVRIACNIPCPGVNAVALEKYMAELAANAGGGLLGTYLFFQAVRWRNLQSVLSVSCPTSLLQLSFSC